MPRCRVDPTLKRTEIDGIAFPLGAYPVEEMSPRTGYTLTFEPADGDDDEGDWEEWPDRYVFDIFLSAVRVESLCRSLFAMLPGRFYPILDVLGHDEYREVDPYVAYELISQERFHDAIRRYRGFFYEDGLVGFGAMSEEPFVYIFIDEHKIVTVRVQADMRERVERLLAAFDLTEVEEIAGADAATHEHRGVLEAPDDRMDLLTADEIVEELRNDWGLVLNIDPDTNVDDDGNEVGITAWRCLVRQEMSPPGTFADESEDPTKSGDSESVEESGEKRSRPRTKRDKRSPLAPPSSQTPPPAVPPPASSNPASKVPSAGTPEAEASTASGSAPPPPPTVKARYAEVLLTAESISAAESLLWEGMDQLSGKTGENESESDDDTVNIAVALDRVRPESFEDFLSKLPESDPMHGVKPDMDEAKVWHARWLE